MDQRLLEDSTAWRRAMRREMVARRARLSAEEHAAWSTEIGQILRSTVPRPGICAFCWPIKHEPDLLAVVQTWRAEGTIAALPVVLGEAQPLAFRVWTTDSILQPDRYGIPTPVDGEFVHPDLILVPLNGFDGQGFRLGYGGGYFDRTLAVLSPRPLVVGVGFEINRLDSIRPESHDLPLDWIVTEAGAFNCDGSGP